MTDSPYKIQDEEAEAEARRDRQYIAEVGQWVQTFHWQLWLSLDFKYDCNRTGARKALGAYVSSLGPRAYMWTGIERGPILRKIHVHALLGGIGDMPYEIARRAWRHGDAKVEPFSPRLGGAWYASKVQGEALNLGDFQSIASRIAATVAVGMVPQM